MEIFVCKDYDAVSQKAFEVMKDIVANKDHAVLGLATGSTPIGLYQNMIQDHKENGTSYANCQSFNLDEYVGLPRDHKESYYTFMHTNLFSGIDIKEENVHLPYGDSATDCAAYEKAMENVQVDVQVLGIGANGHIGFNEPGTAFDEETHIVTLTEKTRQDNARFFDDDINQVPTHAITMGIATIMKAKKILLIATGANKADAVKAMIDQAPSTDCPASVLQNHKDVVVILDEEAAAKLNR
ncbi:MAG: glucosamine-6-phosphate deaminase [Erysipelotrichaceae bacterium]|nr:glucosamine-6-phosphate deaminase [Erysipelotrichaceae bacterium]MCI9311736.1 glucosamine-6-phosphate deaminase [Erysipelotrichaceae bacterium]